MVGPDLQCAAPVGWTLDGSYRGSNDQGWGPLTIEERQECRVATFGVCGGWHTGTIGTMTNLVQPSPGDWPQSKCNERGF